MLDRVSKRGGKPSALHLQTENKTHMDTLTILIITAAALALVGLAFIGGYELGNANGTDAERALANRRINGLLKQENARKPRKRRASK